MFTQLRRRGRDPNWPRRTKTWNDPIRWNAAAAETGVPALVFTCSLSDWFHDGADEWRPEAWQVIRQCPYLRFQVLTKRPFQIAEHLPPDWGEGYDNVWLGVSIEDNEHVWRSDTLRKIPARVRFISAEPLLGPLPDLDLRGFHWLIVGGESGSGFRPMDRNWARQLRDMAKSQGVAYFFKQSSAFRPGQGDLLDGRRWHEFPPLTVAEDHPPETQKHPRDETEGIRGEEARDPESEGSRAGQEQRQKGVQDHADQVADQQDEGARTGEGDRHEKGRLRAELQRQQQEVASLRAELEKQQQEKKKKLKTGNHAGD
jgi:protein gp37